MRQWGLVAFALLFLILIFRAPFAPAVYLVTAWIAFAAGKAVSHGEGESYVPSDFVAEGKPADLNRSEPGASDSPHFNFPQDPASDRGTAGDLHWTEDSGDAAGTDKG